MIEKYNRLRKTVKWLLRVKSLSIQHYDERTGCADLDTEQVVQTSTLLKINVFIGINISTKNL